ncbi:hypothetical protein R1flu_016103 [Riccia fluitans]|uniref:Uncharacterized protein n=1 Tax=Riccia fluitans TaxID=41844 RepID=A0ABD1YPQ8_9MARC
MITNTAQQPYVTSRKSQEITTAFKFLLAASRNMESDVAIRRNRNVSVGGQEQQLGNTDLSVNVESDVGIFEFKRFALAGGTMTSPVIGRPLIQVAATEAKRNWPFVFGFGLTLSLVFKLSTSLKSEDAQKSPFVNVNAHR